MAWDGDAPIALVLEYSGPTPQPLFVMGREDGIAAILRDLIRPRVAYVAAPPTVLPAIETAYRVDPGPSMVRMWVDRASFRPYPATVQRLLPVEIGELNRLYQLGFASWLPSTRHRRRRLLRPARQRPAGGRGRAPTSSARAPGWRSSATS